MPATERGIEAHRLHVADIFVLTRPLALFVSQISCSEPRHATLPASVTLDRGVEGNRRTPVSLDMLLIGIGILLVK